MHALVHRKYHRDWMVPLGVAVPWIAEFCTFTIPAIASTKPVPGQCPMMGVWNSEQAATVSNKGVVVVSAAALVVVVVVVVVAVVGVVVVVDK